jgi:hypothetical protein
MHASGEKPPEAEKVAKTWKIGAKMPRAVKDLKRLFTSSF